jgi:phenylacetate-CoA ligase
MIDLPIGAEAGADRLLRVLNDFRPASVIGTPYFLSYLAEQAPEIIGRKANELGVRSISVGGEPGAGIPGFRDNMESLWGATVREMLGGTDLAPSFWGECEVGEGMHMLFPDLIAVELINPDTGEVIEPKSGVSGELVYTALRREASPLFRFRTRDHVVVVADDCSCGRTGYKIRCVGRTDDMLIIRGINVFPSAIKELVVSFAPETTGELRIRPAFEGHSSQKPLPITVEYSASLPADQIDSLGERIFTRIRSALNFKPVIEMVPEGTLPRPDHVKVALIERQLANK